MTGEELLEKAKKAAAAGQAGHAAALAGQAVRAFGLNQQRQKGHAARLIQSRFLQQAGDLAGAQDVLRAAIEQALRRGDEQGHGNALNELGALLELCGDLRGAAEIFRQLIALFEAQANAHGLAMAKANVGRLVTRLAPPELREAAAQEAQALLREAGGLFTACGRPSQAGQVLVVLGEIMRGSGNLAAAHAALQDAVVIGEQTGAAWLLATAHLNLGLIARDSGENPEADRHLARAEAFAQRDGDRLQLARVHLAQALQQCEALPALQAIELFAKVEAEFAAIGQAHAALPAKANLAAAMARAGRVREAAAMQERLRLKLATAGDAMGAAEVAIATVELQASLGQWPAVDAAVRQLAGAHLPKRMQQRLILIRAAIALRKMQLADAQSLLDELATAELSRSARFSMQLQAAQLAMYRDTRAVAQQLANLRLQASASPREEAAILIATAEMHAWQGELAAAQRLAEAGRAIWRRLGEVVNDCAAAAVLKVAGGEPAAPLPDAAAIQVPDTRLSWTFACLPREKLATDGLALLRELDGGGQTAGALWLAQVSWCQWRTPELFDFAEQLALRTGVQLPELSVGAPPQPQG